MDATRWLACAAALAAVAPAASAQTSLSGVPIHITRAAGHITIDGDLSDEGWRGAVRIDTWYEANPGDNTEPKVHNIGWLTYDDKYFYAAFEFEDPHPSAIRAPLGDHDSIGNGQHDYAGVIVDARNTGRTASMYLATPRNVQYDSITDDNTGEDSSPDFFWNSATKIGPHGWTLEIQIPFSSLRYANKDPQTWGIILYRNYPREFHYQFFSVRLPRNGNCMVCRENTLDGLDHLPSGGHLVAAPYVNASDTAHPRDQPGSPLVNDPAKARGGIDVKFNPTADDVIDATVKPDFSQIESDTAQIAANERFALFFPEKRPFFLEAVDLFKTPIQAVYTRTITAPEWGARFTGKGAGVQYTALVADDAGGGTAIIPGPNGSTSVPQDFGSTVVIARAKRSFGLSFVGGLLTDREAHDGNGHNRVLGPDASFRMGASDVVTGQWLYSQTQTPSHTDLAPEWNGQTLSGSAGNVVWSHNTTHLDWTGLYQDIGNGFRADSGFVPQVGYRQVAVQTGWTVHPTGFFSRVRTFVTADHEADRSGALISGNVQPGVGMDTRWNGFLQVRYLNDRTRAGDAPIGRQQIGYVVQFSPSRRVTSIGLDGVSGQDIDFENARPARGTTLNLSATVQLSDHLALDGIANTRVLYVNEGRDHLLTARVSRLKATYTFTSRMFVRGIGQYVSTDRDPSLYTSPVAPRSADFSGSALFAYKLNWQSVIFVGYGDDRELSDLNRLEKLDREFFVKFSYAFQR
jgi:hypothetical protein